LVCDLLSRVLRALAALAFIKGSKPIPWETQSFGDQSAPQSAPITDYQAEIRHQRQPINGKRPNGWHEKPTHPHRYV
jgi:hypothetical protein